MDYYFDTPQIDIKSFIPLFFRIFQILVLSNYQGHLFIGICFKMWQIESINFLHEGLD